MGDQKVTDIDLQMFLETKGNGGSGEGFLLSIRQLDGLEDANLLLKPGFEGGDVVDGGEHVVVSVSDVFDSVALENGVGDDQTVGADETVDSGADAEGGAPVVGIEEQQLHSVLWWVEQVVEVAEPDKVPLIAVFVRIPDTGFLHFDGIPVVAFDFVDDLDGGDEMIFLADLMVRLPGEKGRSSFVELVVCKRMRCGHGFFLSVSINPDGSAVKTFGVGVVLSGFPVFKHFGVAVFVHTDGCVGSTSVCFQYDVHDFSCSGSGCCRREGVVIRVVDAVVETPPPEPAGQGVVDYLFLVCSSSTAVKMERAMVT